MTIIRVSVLVVDDDARVLRLVQHILELEGYRVLTASDGKTALGILSEEAPDMVLLDIMLPDIDGYVLCQRIREFSLVPIIMVTARGNDEEKVAGLDAGADDYVPKPFSAKELVARVRAILRRSKLWYESPTPAFYFHDLVIDFAGHRVTRGSQEVQLSAIEYRLLSYLARNAGRVLTPDQILEKVWGSAYDGESHLLQVNMARLRQKLGDGARNPRYILTRPGIGYMMMKQT